MKKRDTKSKRNKKGKKNKRKYVWCVLGILSVVGAGIVLLVLLCSGKEKEPVKSPERPPLPEIPKPTYRQEKKMKKRVKFVISGLYFLLILGICIAPLLLLWSRPAQVSAENRTMASLPEIQTAEGFNWNFLQEAGTYFTDHFAYRQEMVAINAGIRSEIFRVSPVEDVIVGDNGWLYYAATLDDYQHKNSISERMLFNIAHNTALMQEYSEDLGKTFVFTIAPNKNSLYDENMPERMQYRLSEKSDAQRLLPWLIREEVHYVDLFELFGEQKEVLYYARDSHWNEKGAVLVYHTLLDACGKAHDTYDGVEPVQSTDYFGDLGAMLYPVGGQPENRMQYPVDDTWYYVEGEKVEDQFIRTENEEGEGNLLMYRDSFGNSLLPYMASTFSQTVFSKQVPYPMSDIVTYEPDILIVEKVERQLPTLGKVPPIMNAPVREMQKPCVSVDSSAATVRLSKEGSYWKLEGAADAAYMDTDSHIYVEVDDGSGARLYEAFCVGSSDGNNNSANDYGYILYVSEVLVTGDTFSIRVMTEQEEAMVVLLKEELTAGRECAAKMREEATGEGGEERVEESITDKTAKDEKENKEQTKEEVQTKSRTEPKSQAGATDRTKPTVQPTAEQEALAEPITQPGTETEEQTKPAQRTAAPKKTAAQTKAATPAKPAAQTGAEASATVQTEAEASATVQTGAEAATAQTETEAAATVQTEAETAAQTAAQAAAQAEAEAAAQAAAQSQGQPAVVEVGRTYMEDCGSDSGYWVITYSDGHVEYLDD